MNSMNHVFDFAIIYFRLFAKAELQEEHRCAQQTKEENLRLRSEAPHIHKANHQQGDRPTLDNMGIA